MSSAIRHLFNPLPRLRRRTGRGGGRPDPFFADPDVVEDDYRRMRPEPR